MSIKRISILVGIGFGVLLLLWGVFIFIYTPLFSNQGDARLLVLNNQLSDIQIELEKYADSHEGKFPQSINELDIKLPINPFNSSENMRNIILGDKNLTKGAFTYIPLEVDNETKGYFLFGYRENVENPNWNKIIESTKNNDPLDDYIVLFRSPGNLDIPDTILNESIDKSLRNQCTPVKYQNDIKSFLILNSR